MRTMFSLGFGPQHGLFGFPARHFMGQNVDMSQDTRNKLLADINRAAEEYKAITAWKNSTPNWQVLLASDLLKVNQDLLNADSVAANALSAQRKLSAAGPSWAITEQEWNDSNSWVLSIDDATNLVKTRGGIPTPGAQMPQASTVSPLMVGVGAAAAVGVLAVLFG